MHTIASILPTLGLLAPPNWSEYGAVLPGAIPCLTALLLILLNVFHKGSETSRDYQAYVSAIGLAVSIASVWLLWDDTVSRPVFHGMLYLDKFTLFFAALFSASGIIACLLSPKYLANRGLNRPEYYLLLLSSVTGMNFLAAAADLMTFFVAFEVMSIPVYCIAGYLREDTRSGEAAMKYFILGAFSSALMLYGIALLYGATGTTNLEFVGQHAIDLMMAGEGTLLVVFGSLLLLSGFAFKIASAPFHLWTPDVYTGSPTPSVGFMATAVKASAFAPMIRVLQIAYGYVGSNNAVSMRGGFYALTEGFLGYGWVDILIVISGASMVLGNLVAITQDNVKRMLAYSTIAHAGYILVGVAAAGAKPGYFLYNDAVLFYLVTYTFGTLGAFGVLAYFDRPNKSTETYEDLAGLGFEHPTMGLLMGVFMFSSAGIPPTAGFVGKLYIFRTAVDVGIGSGGTDVEAFAFIGLAVLAVLTSVAGVYYYLKVLVSMYMKSGDRDVDDEKLHHPSVKGALVACGVLTLYLGIFPAKAIDLSREAVTDFTGAPPSVQRVLDQAQEKASGDSADTPGS